MAEDDDTGIDAGVPEEPLPSMDMPLPKRRIWPVFVVLFALVGGLGFLVYRELTAPLPLRVLVAVDVEGYWWDGSKPAAVMADYLSDHLSDMGLEPIKGGDPEVIEVLESTDDPIEAARKLRAAFVITGVVTPEVVKLPVKDGYHEARVKGHLEVRHLLEDAPLAEVNIETFAGSRSPERVQEMYGRSAARHALHNALPAIFAHVSIQDILGGGDPKLIDALTPGKNYVAALERNLSEANAAYKDLGAAQESTEGVAFHSPANSQDRLLGVTPNHIVVATSDTKPFFSPKSLEMLRNESLEAVMLRQLKPGTEDVVKNDQQLWLGYQAFTYPTSSGDGKTVAIVENLYGYARTLAIASPGQKLNRLKVEPKRRLSEPRVSPSGKAIALIDRPCKDCANELSVLSLPDGKEKYRLRKGDYVRLETFRWAGDGHLLVLFSEPPDPEADPEDPPPAMTLWSIDLATGEKASIVVAEGNTVLTDPAATTDGKHVAISRYHAGMIAVVDVAAGELKQFPINGKATSLAISPDGRFVAYELRPKGKRGKELGLLDTKSGTAKALTNTPYSERFPAFSPDGARLYFEMRAEDPVFTGRRELIRIASVAVPK